MPWEPIRYRHHVTQGSLFSTYRAGENRVTASMLAVFERLEIARLERIIGAAMEETTFQLVRFQNQVTKGTRTTVSAAVIAADLPRGRREWLATTV